LPRMSSNLSIEKILCFLPSPVALNNNFDCCPNIEFVDIAPYKITNTKTYNELKIILNKFQPDVVYVPMERFFAYEKTPVVNMLQNMEPFVCPFSGNPLSEKIKNWFRLYTAQRALKRADRLIAISNFVKDYFVNQLHIDSQKIGLVYHGINKSVDQAERPVAIPETCVDFLFTAGSIRPARGLDDILEAMKNLINLKQNMSLVIAGNTDPVMVHYQQKLINWIERNRLSPHIIWTGNLNESEMAWCYQNCSAFVMTSRVEACPNIVLEALAYGCICISTETPPMPEIFGDAAVYYNSDDGKTLSEIIKTVFSWNQSKKEYISQRSIERASQFSWDVCAKKTIEQFQLAIEDFA
jgi:glycosyltransferase involved in cell wall biosynthesis